jgi:hypothetical protein
MTGRRHRLPTLVTLAVLAAATSCALTRPDAGNVAAAPALVPFTAPESMARLGRSRHRVDFFHLANEFESQTTRTFCGPTSAAIVLNALRADDARVEKPEDPSLVPTGVRASLPKGFDPLYHRYTQNDLFTPAAERVKTRNAVLGAPSARGTRPAPGLELRQLHELLGTAGVDSRLRVVDDALPDATVRAEIVENLGTPDDYVIVNYSRAALGQEGGGHISPLGAYDEESDSFLILDVNPNGHRWVWAPAAALIRAMRTRDTAENRGYLLVREGARSAGAAPQGGGATVGTKPPL